MEDHYFSCSCHSSDHVFKVIYDPDDGDFYLDVHLSPARGFWGRLRYGLRYAFGYRSRYGCWDSTLLDDAEIARLRDLCERALAARKAREGT